MQAIAALGRQLVDGHRGTGKLTGFYAVLQTSTGVPSDRSKSIIIDCYGAKRTEEEKDLIMAEWGKQQRAARGTPRKPGAASAVGKLPSPPNVDPPRSDDADADTTENDGDTASGSDAADRATYPQLVLNSVEVLLSLPNVEKGDDTLSSEDLKLVLSRCGLRSYKEFTYNLVKAIFKKAHSRITGRGTRKSGFLWSRATPHGLLVNKWRMAGSPLIVDGGCFFPPDSKSTSQRGVGIEKRRIALCIAAHISPFWCAVMRGYFKDNPVNKVALAKRFRRSEDAFANAHDRGSWRKKLRKLSHDVKAKGAVDKAGERKPPVQSDDEYKDDEAITNADIPLAPVRISQLAGSIALPLEDLLHLDVCPLLPASALLSVVSLPAAEFESLRQDENALRVVLPRKLVKRAVKLLETAEKSANGIELDGQAPSGAAGAGSWKSAALPASPALLIKVGEHPPVRCSSVSLVHMSSVLALNEQMKRCAAFRSWLQAQRQSPAPFPSELEFLVGSRMSVANASESVLTACAKQRMGDPAWRYFLSSAGARGDVAGSELYGGCSVAFSDIVLGGQREYMTNGVLDAALVEMRHHPTLRIFRAYVLLTGQSAAFTTCHHKRVDEDDAVLKIKEIYSMIPPACCDRVFMMLNLMGQHWISVEVLLVEGVINVFDSSDGGFQDEKDFTVQRVNLFTRKWSAYVG